MFLSIYCDRRFFRGPPWSFFAIRCDVIVDIMISVRNIYVYWTGCFLLIVFSLLVLIHLVVGLIWFVRCLFLEICTSESS